MRNHMMRRIIALTAFLALRPCPYAAAQDVKCEKYQLPNGMTVILHEDRSLPIAAINIWYRVGSKDEPARRSGFAHLFEHLMFMGTQRVPGNQFDLLMETGGGSNNATTSADRTNYFSSGPDTLLPTLLWLDADRLEDLARTMNQEKLDKQRDVVRNERRQSYENRPYGKAELRIQELMYPPNHPYHIPVIGTHQDLEAAQVTDVKDFFATYYVPNNASLVVAGSFDPSAIKPLVASLFGSLPRGGDVPHRTAEPVHLDRVIRQTMCDKVQLPLLALCYHSPPHFAEGDAEMDLVAALLSDGKSSRLYKRLVFDDRLAVQVDAYQDSQMLGSMFRVDVLAKPDADLDRVERVVDEELVRLAAEGPAADELARRKAVIELEMLSGLQSIEAKADRLNEYEFVWGEPNSFKRDLDRFRSATPPSVRAWAARVLTPQARVILRVLPEAPPRGATPRDQRPADLPASQFSPQRPEAFRLSNGVPVMHWRKPGLPLVAMTVVFKSAGPLHEAGRAGLSALLADMLDEGAGTRDALAFADAVQSLGATFTPSADYEHIDASMTVIKRNFAAAADLLADALIRPRLAESDWDRVRKLHLDALRQAEENPAAVAAVAGARALFGDASPYGRPLGGTVDTVTPLTLDDVRTLHAAVVRPDACTLLIAGDLTADEAKSTFERALGGWKPAAAHSIAAVASPDPPISDAQGLRVVLVNRPEAVQTVVRFVLPGPPFAAAQRVQYRLLNALLGGSFTSRLNQNLREKHGFTYGVRSSFTMGPRLGWFVASSSVRADATGAAVREFLNEVDGLRGGNVSEEEVVKARETVRTDVIQAFQRLGGVLAIAAERLVNDAPFDGVAGDLAAMTDVRAAQLNSLARPALPLEKGVLVLVGDKGLILKQIKGLPLPEPIEVSPRGEPLAPVR